MTGDAQVTTDMTAAGEASVAAGRPKERAPQGRACPPAGAEPGAPSPAGCPADAAPTRAPRRVDPPMPPFPEVLAAPRARTSVRLGDDPAAPAAAARAGGKARAGSAPAGEAPAQRPRAVGAPVPRERHFGGPAVATLWLLMAVDVACLAVGARPALIAAIALGVLDAVVAHALARRTHRGPSELSRIRDFSAAMALLGAALLLMT
ncbi:MAG: hypothetical protein SOI26_04680 [Coriobacteriales bacterium]|jgi:hypothetical protein